MDATAATLVISPHIDDEVLGCFSFLSPQTRVLYCGVEDRPSVSATERVAEMQQASDELGFKWDLLDNTVNSYQVTDLIGPIERWLNEHRPATVLVPQPSSYNQDHRAVFEAAMVATRPHDENWMVPEVLVYEQPHTMMWPVAAAVEPTVFREIDMAAKIAAYQLYESQVRGHRSPEIIEALARLRGAQIGRPYAEAFGVKRLVRSRLPYEHVGWSEAKCPGA